MDDTRDVEIQLDGRENISLSWEDCLHGDRKFNRTESITIKRLKELLEQEDETYEET